MVEITPSSIRIRKVELNAGKRHILAGKLKKKDTES
jgi:GTP-binding protein